MPADNLTFPTPEGFQPPEHLDSDDTFQAMATFKVVSEDELQLVDIEGYQIGEEDTEGDTEAAKAADQANALAAVQGASNATGGATAPNQSEDQLGGPPNQVGGFASQMGQMFRKATGRR
jgi:hypothetical protein